MPILVMMPNEKSNLIWNNDPSTSPNVTSRLENGAGLTWPATWTFPLNAHAPRKRSIAYNIQPQRRCVIAMVVAQCYRTLVWRHRVPLFVQITDSPTAFEARWVSRRLSADILVSLHSRASPVLGGSSWRREVASDQTQTTIKQYGIYCSWLQESKW